MIASCICVEVQGQNLVPNPSFEDTLCVGQQDPSFFGAEHWFNSNDATPDYYSLEDSDDCNITHLLDDFLLQFDWQLPLDGEKMIGLWCGDTTACTRDILQIELLEALEAGTTYCTSFSVNLSNRAERSTDCIGIRFLEESITNYESPCYFGLDFHIRQEEGQVLSDTVN